MTSTTPHPSNLPRRMIVPEIACWQGGTGPAMALIHGVGLRAEAWRYVLPTVCERFSVTAIDMPGHGESPLLPDRAAGLAAYVETIGRAFSALDGPVFVIGHSMGAMIALQLAEKFPTKVSAVAAINAVYNRSPDASEAVKARAAQLSDIQHADPRETVVRWFGKQPAGPMAKMAAECDDWLSTVDPVGYRRAYTTFAKENGPSDTQLAALVCPALFVTGADEPNSTPSMSRSMAKRASNGRAVIIQGGRHMVPMTHADALAAHLITFAEGEADG